MIDIQQECREPSTQRVARIAAEVVVALCVLFAVLAVLSGRARELVDPLLLTAALGQIVVLHARVNRTDRVLRTTLLLLDEQERVHR